MALSERIALVAFDFFGTLASNTEADWHRSFARVVEEQGLPIEPSALWVEWRKFEINFRKTRTHMSDPASSPPFRSYWEAWRNAFVDSFASLGLSGDAALAASRCLDEHGTREAFPEAHQALADLKEQRPLAVLSNADDRFLLGSLAHNGWTFDTVLSSEQAKAYKPDPRIFATFCSLTGLRPEQVLYVGDSAYDDAHGAKLAGMETVLIVRDLEALAPNAPGRTPPPDATTLLPPDHVIERLTELTALLADA